MSSKRLGDLFLQLNRTEEAIEKYQDQVKIRRRLAEANPNNVLQQDFLVNTLNKLGAALLRDGRTEEARKQYQDGLKITRRLATGTRATCLTSRVRGKTSTMTE